MSENSIHEGFKITELGPLPEGWEVVGLGAVAEKFIGGGTPSTRNEEYWNGEIHWTTSKKINGIYLLNGEKKITKRGLEESSTHLIPKDNLVIGTRVGVGKVAINKVDIAISQDLTGAFIDKEKYALEFLAYQICTKEIQNVFKGRARGTTIKGIPRDDLKKIPLKIPPLPEQHCIAAVLSAVQDAKEKTEAVIAAAKSLKKSLMRHLFTYGPVPAGAAESVPLVETEIGLVPEGWGVVRLKDVTREKIKNGAFIKRNRFGGGLHFLNVADTYNRLNIGFKGLERVQCTDEELKLYSIQPNDLFYVRSSLKREGVGQCCITEYVPEPSIYDCHLMRVRVDVEKMAPKFIAYYSTTTRGKQALIARSKTTTMTTINQSGLASFLISMPPLPTQQKIASILSAVDKKIEAEENKKKALDELFKSLLRNLMTGKIRVNHPEVIS